jgi:phage-related protein
MNSLLEIEKNKLSSTVPWLILAEVTIPDGLGTIVYLVRNTEDIVFNSQTYTAFPFELDAAKQVSKGEIPTFTIKCGNVSRALQAHIEIYDGLVDEEVTIRIVAKPTGSLVYLEAKSLVRQILGCTADANFITWTLGMPNPLARRFPLHRYVANHCNWTFKGVECAYSGALTTCKRTLSDCQSKSNSGRYGGYQGMASGDIKLAM